MTQINRKEPDDNIRTFTRQEEICGEPTPEQIEAVIAKFKAANPPAGFKKVHDDICSWSRPMTIIKVVTVYERESPNQ